MNFEKSITESGIPIYYMEMPYVKSVVMGMLVKAGTRDEEWPEEAGIAHALEHMLFRGTEDFPNSQKLCVHIEDVGGGVNAWTSQEMSLFYNRLPADKAERGIYCLSQMLRRPLLLKDDTETEMQNIIQEINRDKDNPQSYLLRRTDEIIYNNHPLGRNGLGLEQSLAGFNQASFRKFMRKFYHPRNHTFIIAGNFQIKQIRDLLEKYFPEKSDKAVNKRSAVKIKHQKEKLFIMNREIEQCHLVIGAPICGNGSPDKWPISVFRAMIDGGMSSPLFQEIRDKRGLAYEVWASCSFWSDLGYFGIYVGTDPKRLDKSVEATLRVLKNNKKLSLLKRAKEMMTGRLALRYESPLNILNMAAEELGKAGNIMSFEEKKKKIEEVTAEQIIEVCDRYLSEEKLITVMLTPKK